MQGQRSGIPKVIGILMIIFGSLGLLFGLIGLAGGSGGPELDRMPEFKTFQRMSMISTVVGLGISGLHLFAGMSAVRYRSTAPKLAMAYGWIAIGFTITWSVIVYAWLKPMLETAVAKSGELGAGMISAVVGFGVIFGAIIGITWPVIVLALMSRPAAKQACQGL